MSESNWYVVHTYSGYENKVKANIEKTIENRHLEEQILEVKVPLTDVQETKNGVTKTTKKKLFPGYVLINMIMNDDTWYVVRNIRDLSDREASRSHLHRMRCETSVSAAARSSPHRSRNTSWTLKSAIRSLFLPAHGKARQVWSLPSMLRNRP